MVRYASNKGCRYATVPGILVMLTTLFDCDDKKHDYKWSVKVLK